MFTNSKKHLLTLLGAWMVAQQVVAAPVQISITGTADTTSMGYTAASSYTFNWVINDAYSSANSGDAFSSTRNFWNSENTTDTALWSSVSGDGLAGTYSRPSGSTWAPWERLESTDDTELNIIAANDDVAASSMGLTVNGIEVQRIRIDGIDLGISFDYPEAFTNPADYFADYAGTYTPTSEKVYIRDESSNDIYFTATSVTIGVVPEPATAGLLGISAIVFYALRRIKNSYRIV